MLPLCFTFASQQKSYWVLIRTLQYNGCYRRDLLAVSVPLCSICNSQDEFAIVLQCLAPSGNSLMKQTTVTGSCSNVIICIIPQILLYVKSCDWIFIDLHQNDRAPGNFPSLDPKTHHTMTRESVIGMTLLKKSPHNSLNNKISWIAFIYYITKRISFQHSFPEIRSIRCRLSYFSSLPLFKIKVAVWNDIRIDVLQHLLL